MTPYPIIGMSPGNSYFKDEEVSHLLKQTVEKFGQAAILVADIPAIATYLAYGYPENRARNKAIPKGNNLKNRSLRMAQEMGIADKVRIIDWENEIEPSEAYHQIYASVRSLYDTNPEFSKAVDQTTATVLEVSGREIPNLEAATKVAVHYLLSEIAFLEFAPAFFAAEQVVYVYHRNWPVYERYVAGLYDGVPKPHLEFLLLEHPTETYRPLQGEEQMERISTEQTLHCAFTHYPPGFIEDPETGEFSGIFHDLIQAFCQEHNWTIEWTEEVGYGVIQHGLDEGRYDIFVAPVWPTPERLAQANVTESIYSSEVGMWVREENLSQAQAEDFATNSFVRVAIKEGDITDSIALADFPSWRRIRVPQLTDTEELLRFVAQGDADVTFAEQYLVDEYNKTSEVKLVNAGTSPVRTFSNCFMLSKQNAELTEMLNVFLRAKREGGELEKKIRHYAPDFEGQGIKA